jgi:hypothetical protein
MRYFTLGFLIIIAFSCCQDDVEYKSNINLPQLRSEWAREYEAWKNLDIQNYQFTYQLPDYYGPDMDPRITVKNGQFYEAINIKTGEKEERSVAFTIDSVFLSINKAFDQDERKEVIGNEIGTLFSIRYDPEYHFPSYHYITKIFNGNNGGDAPEYIIKDFTIIDE